MPIHPDTQFTSHLTNKPNYEPTYQLTAMIERFLDYLESLEDNEDYFFCRVLFTAIWMLIIFGFFYCLSQIYIIFLL